MTSLPLLLLAACVATSDLARHDPRRPGDTGDPADPNLRILSPQDGEVAENPVTFRFKADPAVVSAVTFEADGATLTGNPIPATGEVQEFRYDFLAPNFERVVSAVGLDAGSVEVARARVTFIPDEGWLPDEAGFNHYVVDAINDTEMYPKDQTYPYCWEYYGSTCGENWGMIWGGAYLGEPLFPGGEDCFCSGHTLEIFLDAYERWQDENGAGRVDPYGGLTLDDVDLGDFYQHWQGYGVGTYASAAAAFEYAGIGELLDEEDWDAATTGDFVNLSRSTGSGHSTIFVDWVWEGDERVGLRYYGCNGGGDSHPDETDPDNQEDVSGPSFVTEYFDGHGGTVLTRYLFIGHPYDPAGL